MTTEEAILAHAAISKLSRLYHAYRATYRANGMMLHKLQGQIAQDGSLSAQAKIYAQQDFAGRKAYAQQMDMACRLRLEQLATRWTELRAWRP